ncbi:tubulinyl-Tyr carboxypeptidase 2 [Microcaecilia unicolor]|uniref:Tubulinyl-Tyr carboxypeptidase 2 n=1 Tax=Microcaecilia unicolor TaxID=1415580 RepID=A0A6P7X8I7_9AMPH|nr:tubulinyl-Tyr carboxypeptidase 2 [Microcaecilia unicolor]
MTGSNSSSSLHRRGPKVTKPRSRSTQDRPPGASASLLPPSGGSEEEGDRDGAAPFHVNRSGFPVEPHTWERMWLQAARIHPEGKAMVEKIRNSAQLPVPPIPAVPIYRSSMSIPDWLQAVQSYMKMLQYNHTGTQLFEIRKTRPLSGLMETAKEMTREALPIKCLEAVILGIYLTNAQPAVERFPISFKTQFSGNYFHHVVLGIYYSGCYGALGMSRRSDLMDKPLTFRTLSDLIFEFEESYKKYFHSVKKVKIGLYVPHDPHSFQPIEWRQLVLNVGKMMQTDLKKELEKYARDMRMKILKASSAQSPVKERCRGKSLSPPRRACRRDKSPAALDKKPAELSTLNEVGYQIRI